MALAIFDLDNTLIAGDSDHSWGQFLVDKKAVDVEAYKRRNDQFYRDYEAGQLDMTAYLEFSLQPLTQLSIDQLADLHREFMREVIQPLMLPKAEQLLASHRNQGDFLLVITSTNRFIVEPICKQLGVDDLIATEPDVEAGRYTGKIKGIPSFQEGKITRLEEWLQNQPEDMDGSYFYSDSINDLPLLLEVDYPVAVDPDEALRAQATQRGWDIISLR